MPSCAVKDLYGIRNVDVDDVVVSVVAVVPTNDELVECSTSCKSATCSFFPDDSGVASFGVNVFVPVDEKLLFTLHDPVVHVSQG